MHNKNTSATSLLWAQVSMPEPIVCRFMTPDAPRRPDGRIAGIIDRDLFTPAERLVAVHLREGLANKEIAAVLGKQETTVKYQVACILRKLNVCNRGRAIARLHQSEDPISLCVSQ